MVFRLKSVRRLETYAHLVITDVVVFWFKEVYRFLGSPFCFLLSLTTFTKILGFGEGCLAEEALTGLIVELVDF